MDSKTPDMGGELSRQAGSAAISGLGWRYICGRGQTFVRVGSLRRGAGVATSITGAVGGDAGDCLRMDLRPDRLILTVQSPVRRLLTAREAGLAQRISEVVTGLGLTTEAGAGGSGPRPVQGMEIAIDAMDIGAIRPFWKAVLSYTDEAWAPAPGGGIVDPFGQGPAFWFQQMDEPRPQRNRIHFDICVPHDEAQHRIQAALAAGGTLVSDDEAPAFWILADAEGNEACITTWQGRDP
jgi:4a-hydroxytetrahydrobiopterin dehydratase